MTNHFPVIGILGKIVRMIVQILFSQSLFEIEVYIDDVDGLKHMSP